MLGIAATSLALPSLAGPSPAAAQGSIPDGVFVRESNGSVWMVLKGQRVAVPIWSASDAEIAALPQSGSWAVLSVNDAGAMVAGGRPAWYVDAAPSQPPAVSAAPASVAQPVTSGQLVVTSTATWVEKMFGSTYVVGIIENQSGSDLTVKTIAVSLLGANGETVGSASALDKPGVLKAGAKGPWRSRVSGTPSFSDNRIQVESGPIDNRFIDELIQDFRAEGVTAQARRPGSQAMLVGQVVNASAKTTGTAKVIGAVYSNDGQLLDVASSYSKLETLPPGQSAPFELTFLAEAARDPSRYELYIEARAK